MIFSKLIFEYQRKKLVKNKLYIYRININHLLCQTETECIFSNIFCNI